MAFFVAPPGAAHHFTGHQRDDVRKHRILKQQQSLFFQRAEQLCERHRARRRRTKNNMPISNKPDPRGVGLQAQPPEVSSLRTPESGGRPVSDGPASGIGCTRAGTTTIFWETEVISSGGTLPSVA